MEENKKEEIELVKESVTEPVKDKKGQCIAAMVLGIISLVFFCVLYVSIPCAIIAIVFGILGIKTPNKGMAIAGLVTGAISIVITVCMFIGIFMFGITAGMIDSFDDYSSYDRSYYNESIYD